MLDYEGELGVVIGRRCRHVPKDRAHEVVAGYVVANDVSVRDWQIRVPTFTMGKSFDTHCPMGPWIVTTDELADPGALELKTWVNGERAQSATLDAMVFAIPLLLAHAEAGDGPLHKRVHVESELVIRVKPPHRPVTSMKVV